MPKKETKKETKKTNEFREFENVFGDIKLSCRIYPEKENGNVKKSFMYLELLPGLTIQCHFVETKNNYWISFPQYKSGEEYKSYVFVEKDSEIANALDALADYLYNNK